MKNIIVLIFFALFISDTMAQSKAGVIRNFKNFMDGSYEEYQEYWGIRHAMGSFTVIFKDGEGKKVKLKVDHKKMWGFVTDDERMFRVDENNKPGVIMILGEIVVYGNYTTHIKDGNATMRINQFMPKISKGINGEMINLTKKNLKKMIPASSPYYEGLKDCRKYVVDLVDFVKHYNREMKKEIEKEVENMKGHR